MTTEPSSPLPEDPKAAVTELKARSRSHPVVVFKKSPICPISDQAELECRAWMDAGPKAEVAFIDVLGEKALARGLTAELGIDHASPQALLFRDGELAWHASHRALTRDAFREQVGS